MAIGKCEITFAVLVASLRLKRLILRLPLKLRYVFRYNFSSILFSIKFCVPDPYTTRAASQKLRTKKKRQVKKGTSSPIECFTALLTGQNMFKIPLLPCAWQVVWSPQPKTVVLVLSWEYTCEKRLQETDGPRPRSHQLQHRSLTSFEPADGDATHQKLC